MLQGRTTISKFLIEQLRGADDQADLAALLVDVTAAVKAIAAMTSKGALGGYLGALASSNVQGETQKRLDVLANDVLIQSCAWSGLVAGMASEELEQPYTLPPQFERGPFLLLFDPLDGSSNIDVNVAVGTIFSVLRARGIGDPQPADYLRPGFEQVAAGYAIYGPSTMMVLSVGKGSHGFTLDREIGNFILTHPDLRIPEETGEFAINASNERFWEPPVQRYVAECKAGSTGDRGRDFNTRWIASLVAEVHRILMRGGVFLYPRDCKDAQRAGRLRLLYEANPMAMVVEQAGGAASTGRQRILDVEPTQLHQRVPVLLGSRSEVLRLERYHQEYDSGLDKPFVSPLFKDRSLFAEGPRA